MNPSPAPRRTERLLESLSADTEFRDEILGDLAEEYALRVRWDGPNEARRWYRREGARVAPYLVRDWMQTLRWRDAGYFATAIGAASLVQWAFVIWTDRAVLSVVHHGVPIPLIPLWTAIDAIVGGYVVTLFARRAPLQTLLAFTLGWTALFLGVKHHLTSPFWIANTAGFALGALLGGLLRTRQQISQEIDTR